MKNNLPDSQTLADAQNAILKRIASLVTDKPEQVESILAKHKIFYPLNATHEQLASIVGDNLLDEAFVGDLYSAADAYAKGNLHADGDEFYNAGADPVSAIANAIGAAANASATIAKSVLEKDTAKINQKSKLIDFVTSKDTNRTQLKIAQAGANKSGASAGDNTMMYVGIGVGTLVVLGLLAVVVMKSSNSGSKAA